MQTPSEVSDQEADSLLKFLQQQAQEWRALLQHPAVRKLVEEGKIQISPLVLELLKIEQPPVPPSSTT